MNMWVLLPSRTAPGPYSASVITINATVVATHPRFADYARTATPVPGAAGGVHRRLLARLATACQTAG